MITIANHSLKKANFIFILLFILFLSFDIKAQTLSKIDTSSTNNVFVNWAKANSFSLQDADKAIGYNDMHPIKKMIGNARVVAMGESSHGLHAPQTFRNRLFKYLVEQCGFTTIVVEAGIAESMLANKFVTTGEGSAEAAAQKLTIGKASAENIELMHWMRAYNANPIHKNKLKFYGMDVEIIGYPGDTLARHTAIDSVLNYLRKVDPESETKLKTTLSPYLNRLSAARYPELSSAEHDHLSTTLDDIILLLERQRIDYIAKSTKDEYEWVHRLAFAAHQTDRVARVTPLDPPGKIPPSAWKLMSTRDAAMADNVMWILNNRAGGKVLVYSHNSHVKNAPTAGSVWDAFSKPPNALGQYLRSVLGNDYFVIGTSYAPSAKTAQNGSVDLALLNVGKPRFIIDLKAATVNLQVKKWLDIKRPMEANLYSFLNLQIGATFDALLFINK